MLSLDAAPPCRMLALSRTSPTHSQRRAERARWQGVTGSFDPDDLLPTRTRRRWYIFGHSVATRDARGSTRVTRPRSAERSLGTVLKIMWPSYRVASHSRSKIYGNHRDRRWAYKSFDQSTILLKDRPSDLPCNACFIPMTYSWRASKSAGT